MIRCAIYARVSKRKGKQEPANQLAVLREYAGRAGWTITHEFTDRQTGATLARPELARMTTAASRREFDVLLFWRFDRLTRSGIKDTLQTLAQLREYGVDYHSHQEPHIRSQGALGELVVAIVATIAAAELEANRARTLAGLDRARKNGRTLGRPRRIASATVIEEMRACGATYSEIAKATRLSRATVIRRLQEMRAAS